MEFKLKKVLKYIIGLLAFLLSLPFLFYFCWRLFGGDYEIRLPAGFCLVRVYAGAVLLADPNNHVIISPNIDGYKIVDHVLVGHVSCDNLPSFSEEAKDCKPGYFMVDVREGQILPVHSVEKEKNNYTIETQSISMQQGLDEQQWIDSLRKYGITEKPRLHKPSRFDRK